MFRLALLVLYLAASVSFEIGGGWDPNGLNAQPPGDLHGNLDPNGAQVPPSGDAGGGWDPNG